MPTSDYGEPRRIAMRTHGVSLTPPTSEQQEQQQLACPRCHSTNTKFCYYNNYNFSQPRHFCKSCRRYWTQGGTLRDVPVGGASRKSAKRSRTSSSSPSSSSSSAAGVIRSVTPVLFPQPSISNGVSHHTDAKGSALSLCGSFTSLLNHNAAVTTTHVPGGFGSGFDDVSFGLGRAVWPPFTTVVGDATTANVASHGGHHAVQIPATWQFESNGGGGGGYVPGEYFAWPDLSIATLK